jgi:hypothetical protein
MLLCIALHLVVAPVVADPAGTATNPDGKQIFRKLCAKCHGPNGDGVKGKYDHPLQGERPLEKLARYIERNMPDDHPGKCTGPEAQAVARYIFDAFYSPQAQARIHPVHIELARLTNKQYLNTIADLLKHFTGADEPVGPKRGLQATYYNSKDFSSDKKALERVDERIEFDFGDGTFDVSQSHSTNEFSIQWRGSILADESGDYEFILKTPNGARLWVNDNDEPLIDAWVASGKLTEHKATIRLIGGRAYPIRINYFRFKDKTSSIGLWWKPPRGAFQIIPARNLSPGRTTPTFVVTTPFPPDDSSYGYERGVAVSKAWDEAATQAAIEVANHVVTKLDALSHSRPSDTNREERVESFCAEFAATAFHRPLTAEQKAIFVSNRFKKGLKLEESVARSVLLVLKSPRFQYPGLHEGKPDDYDIASRLSLALWDSLPDTALTKAAGAGQLHDSQSVREQAQRMLNDPRARAKMQLFLQHWLQMDRVEPLSKDDQLYPGFSPEVIADLRVSLDLFLEDTVWNGSSDYRDLLRADYLFMNNRLATFYGLNTNLTDDFVRVSFDSEKRSGVLTHPYLLSAFSYTRLTSPIHRGVFLTRNIVGRSLRPPPMAMTFKDADFAPNLTMREKVTELTKPQACQACHSVINPLGFSLEQFDAVGKFRSSENDKPVNPVSEYLTDEGQTVQLSGARDVAEFALASAQAQNAFIEQLFHHVVKQSLLAYGSDTLAKLRKAFVDSGFNLRQLLVDVATLSALKSGS